MLRIVCLAISLGAAGGGADLRCKSCHPLQTAGYAKTAMAQSIGTPGVEETSKTFQHEGSGSVLKVFRQSGQMIHAIERDAVQERRAIEWAVGSGRRGRSYLIRVNDSLFQSPLSWYRARNDWDLSPGYENDAHPGFFRPITPECLFCHSQGPLPVEGTLNRYRDPPFESPVIGCSRCHGDAARHLSQPIRGNIVNPARLDKDRRDAVCEQCHLSGVARIPNPGKDFSNFQPGMRLEDVFTVYVHESAGDPHGLKVVSHSEQMALSRCFLESKPQLWCGNCHDPHREPEDKVSWYREKCKTCHSNAASLQHEKQSGGDCAGCHMPVTRPYDGGHTAFHDHWIRGKNHVMAASPPGLRPWRAPEPALRDRNLGLAYISLGSRDDPKLLSEGLRLLGSGKADGAVETARGFVFLRAQEIPQALTCFRRAWEEKPHDSTRCLNLAAALLASGNRAEAKEKAERAIEREPLLEDAYALLAEIEPRRAAFWKAKYIERSGRKLIP